MAILTSLFHLNVVVNGYSRDSATQPIFVGQDTTDLIINLTSKERAMVPYKCLWHVLKIGKRLCGLGLQLLGNRRNIA